MCQNVKEISTVNKTCGSNLQNHAENTVTEHFLCIKQGDGWIMFLYPRTYYIE